MKTFGIILLALTVICLWVGISEFITEDVLGFEFDSTAPASMKNAGDEGVGLVGTIVMLGVGYLIFKVAESMGIVKKV